MEDREKLRFNSDGTFRIMQVSDLHMTRKKNELTYDFLDMAVEKLEPDLIVLTGDNIDGGALRSGFGSDKRKLRRTIRKMMRHFDEWGIPVAVCFGNHDTCNKVPKEMHMDFYRSARCVTDGDCYADCGTYNIPVYASDGSAVKYNLWIMDSDDEVSHDNAVTEHRIGWYTAKSQELKEQNNGKPVYSLMFQHMIVPEIYENLTEVSSNKVGSVEKNGKYYILDKSSAKGFIGEAPSPVKQTGELDAVKRQDDVVAMVFGHDHLNAFIAENGGVDLICTTAAGVNAYGDDSRGVRMFTVYEQDTEVYETRIFSYMDLIGKKLGMSL